MAARGKGAGFGLEHVVWLILGAIAFKFAVDEGTQIAEHGFETWRRRRFGW